MADLTAYMAASYLADAADLITRADQLLDAACKSPAACSGVDAIPNQDELQPIATALKALAARLEAADDRAELAADEAGFRDFDRRWEAARPQRQGAA